MGTKAVVVNYGSLSEKDVTGINPLTFIGRD
jgi:hypothetical protein